MRNDELAQGCGMCGGSTWRMVEVNGRSRAVRCDCFAAKKTAGLFRAAEIPVRYQHCLLSDFTIEFARADRSLRYARIAAEKFVERYPSDDGGLIFTGPRGVGKTHLAVGILLELIRGKGVKGYFADYRDLLKNIQKSYDPAAARTEMEILKPVFEAKVLVIDEVGAMRPTEWVLDEIGYILNRRYNDRLVTIMTSNYGLEPDRKCVGEIVSQEILADRIGARMQSRLYEMCRPVMVSGVDFRRLMKQAERR